MESASQNQQESEALLFSNQAESQLDEVKNGRVINTETKVAVEETPMNKLNGNVACNNVDYKSHLQNTVYQAVPYGEIEDSSGIM